MSGRHFASYLCHFSTCLVGLHGEEMGQLSEQSNKNLGVKRVHRTWTDRPLPFKQID